MTHPVVFADFNKLDREGRVWLGFQTTLDDLERLGIELSEGLILRVSDYDDLSAVGTVTWHEREWWAVVDRDKLGLALDPDRPPCHLR